MTSLGLTHTAAAVTALVAGAAVLLSRKGTRRHRQLGWTYVASMLVMDVTALMIYRLFGHFGPFHAGAIFSFVTVVAGTAAAIAARRARGRRDAVQRARALERHYQWMTWSYVGLAAAAVSEIATRMPALRPRPGQVLVFGITVAVATLVVVAVGAQLIRRRRSALLAPYGRSAVAAVPSAPLALLLVLAGAACRETPVVPALDSTAAGAAMVAAAPAAAWYRRAVALDLTSDGAVDTVRLEAFGTRADSLQLVPATAAADLGELRLRDGGARRLGCASAALRAALELLLAQAWRAPVRACGARVRCVHASGRPASRSASWATPGRPADRLPLAMET